MPRVFLVLLLFIILMHGCSSEIPGSLSAFENTFPISGVDSISIEINAGTVEVSSISEAELRVGGSLADAASLEISQSDSRIEIVQAKSGASDTIHVQVPDGSIVNLKTFSADIRIEDFSGDLTLNSSAGMITIAGFSGSATVWAGRGEIAVTDSRGEMILISEHGAIKAESFSGEISMSTIMGSLNYIGREDDQNEIRMEADHGPVSAVFPASADLSISASSTDGEVACIGADIQHTVDGCRVNIGAGAGTVKIRTVTGRVEFRIADVKPES